MVLNKNISVWRGEETPPTDYHLWEKEDGSLHTKIDEEWIQIISPTDISETKNSILGNVSEEYNTLEKVENKILNLDNEIDSIELTTKVVKVSDSVPVAGGPLADQLNKSNITSIDKDISMQDLLMMLFTKELWPSPQFTEGTIKASIAQPSFSLSVSNLVEVNSPITASSCTPAASTYSTTSRKLSGISYGYSEDGESINTSTSIVKDAINIIPTGNYSITRTGVNGTESKSGSNVSDIKLDSATIYAKEGTNTVNVSITGAKYSCTFNEIPSVYLASNLKNISNSHKSTAQSEKTYTSNAPTNSKSLSVTGLYPIYTNSSGSLKSHSLIKDQVYEITFPAESNTVKIQFAIQKSKTLKIEMLNTVSAKYESYDKSKFTTSTVTLQSGGKDTEYILYTRNDGTTFSDSSSFKLTIS